MTRAAIAVAVGYFVWTALWLIGTAIFFDAAGDAVATGVAYSSTGSLPGLLMLSLVCSLVTGWITAAVASTSANRALLFVAAMLLGTGVVVQTGVWNLMPIWYHLIFLALLVPATFAGGRRRSSPAIM